MAYLFLKILSPKCRMDYGQDWPWNFLLKVLHIINAIWLTIAAIVLLEPEKLKDAGTPYFIMLIIVIVIAIYSFVTLFHFYCSTFLRRYLRLASAALVIIIVSYLVFGFADCMICKYEGSGGRSARGPNDPNLTAQ